MKPGEPTRLWHTELMRRLSIRIMGIVEVGSDGISG
jgi:hypothetical protein